MIVEKCFLENSLGRKLSAWVVKKLGNPLELVIDQHFVETVLSAPSDLLTYFPLNAVGYDLNPGIWLLFHFHDTNGNTLEQDAFDILELAELLDNPKKYGGDR